MQEERLQVCSRLSKHGTEAGRLERNNQLGQPAQSTEWKDEGKWREM